MTLSKSSWFSSQTLTIHLNFEKKIRNVIKDSWKTISFKNHGNMQTKLFFWDTEKNKTILSIFTTCEPSPDKYTENSNSSTCIKAVTAAASAPGISGQKFLFLHFSEISAASCGSGRKIFSSKGATIITQVFKALNLVLLFSCYSLIIFCYLW